MTEVKALATIVLERQGEAQGGSLQISKMGQDIVSKYLSHSGHHKLNSIHHVDTTINENMVCFDLKHPHKKPLFTEEIIRKKFSAVNAIEFSQSFLNRLGIKLRLRGEEEVCSFIKEYRKFLMLMACGS